jgi:hypothetical protein
MEFITSHFSEIISLIAGVVGGGTIASVVTFKIVSGQNASHGGRNINQSGSKAGGDIVGGNKSTGSNKRR